MAITVNNISVSGESNVPEGKFEFSYNVNNNTLQNVSAILVDSETREYKAQFDKNDSNISINIPTSKYDTLNDSIKAFSTLCDEITSNIESQD